jgi:hypothetical protein
MYLENLFLLLLLLLLSPAPWQPGGPWAACLGWGSCSLGVQTSCSHSHLGPGRQRTALGPWANCIPSLSLFGHQ